MGDSTRAGGERGPHDAERPVRTVADAAAECEPPELAVGTSRDAVPALGRTATRHDPMTTELLAHVTRAADTVDLSEDEVAATTAAAQRLIQTAHGAKTREMSEREVAATTAAARQLAQAAVTLELSKRELAAIHAASPGAAGIAIDENAVTVDLTEDELAAAVAAEPTADPKRRPPR